MGIIFADCECKTLTQKNIEFMYWNIGQQLAHHSLNGCNIRDGDVMDFGTIRGLEFGTFGSMLEYFFS